jgi:hypothetical protein
MPKHMPDPQPKTPLVGCVAPAGHGKTTLCGYLADNSGFATSSVAKPLKDAGQVLWKLSKRQMYGDEKDKIDRRYGVTAWGLCPVSVAQDLG